MSGIKSKTFRPVVPSVDTVGEIGEKYTSTNGKTYKCVSAIDYNTVTPDGKKIEKTEYVWVCTDDGAGGGEFPFTISDTDPVTIDCTNEELIAVINSGKTPVGYWLHDQSDGQIIRVFHFMKKSDTTYGTSLAFYFCDKTSSGTLEIRSDGTIERTYRDNRDVAIHFASVNVAPSMSHDYADMVNLGATELLKRAVMDISGYTALKPYRVFIGNHFDIGKCVELDFLNWSASENESGTRFMGGYIDTVFVTAEKAYLVRKSFSNCLADA